MGESHNEVHSDKLCCKPKSVKSLYLMQLLLLSVLQKVNMFNAVLALSASGPKYVKIPT